MIDPNVPLIDLHRHLDGSIRLDTIIDLGRQHNLPFPSFKKEEVKPYVHVIEPQPGVMACIEKIVWMVGVLVDYDACRRVAYENVIDAKKEGIDYIELRFSPWFMAEPHNLDPAGVVETVIDGVKKGQEESGVLVNLIGIISRTYGVETGWKEMDALIAHKDNITALDLAGDEFNFPAELFTEHFAKARDLGWKITVHAGEAAGPESIWQAVKKLGATRIGHGVKINEDPALVEYFIANKIGIEANLTSNFQSSTVSDLQSHPLKGWLERGILATINSDDPGIFDIDLRYEYEVAAPAAGLSQEQIRQAQMNALEIAFLSEGEKEALVQVKNGN